ncbi:MAG: cation-translocating P-type ATPase [Carnobacterium sp.]|uniref:Cation-translocating P-type ATPase n=1 Tax=Carnobacterium maltaromaticum TaxID=2751 RepID=A0AAW9JVL0_CARML|nr:MULTISPECIES: cation-translocating P-type ATPase [Carnobacterium]KRN72728.1 cation-transporting atpase [Carnobacterium maltaromaticum]KRN86728.1 cation-transporting atpase [Carnobacterium maltaromaticum]MBC9789770.1 HAD-IC family P-type ATPase [Carnobacterium maltaromaticum]MBQ6484988.1 cation-translocating P-type ATPase [Carnobacterium sp.]MCC4312575.1 ATPase [Carnobacterium maltaromaticum]
MKQSEEILGLSANEVKERQNNGQQNDYQENVAKSTKMIIKDNVWTLFNFLNLAIGVCLAAVGAFSNMVFLVIILVNILIGIYQEIHARNLVAKLAIISESRVTVIRSGKKVEIAATELVMDDIVLLAAGEQVPSDMKVVQGRAEVNEALLTGESELIEKTASDELLSGSFLSSGQCYAQVIHVGKDNYATRIAEEAKVHKPLQSELMNSVAKVAKFTSFVIIPLGLVLFFEAFFMRSDSTQVAVVSSAAALLGMLPKGLVLLISISLATAVTKLANKRILVQDMYSVEVLAHVDTLCLDKTGTITEGKMKVQKVEMLNDVTVTDFETIMGSYLAASQDNNITMQAIRDYYQENNQYTATDILAFSSERKWGAMYLENIGTVVLGAPERLVNAENLPTEVLGAQEQGYRVLMLAVAKNQKMVDAILPELEPLAVFEIDDPIRPKANETLAYLKAEGVDLKVISGDNPVTVSNIARRAGLEDYANYIDLSKGFNDDEVRESASRYSVFGRVSPQQKKILVKALKDDGHVVAMTGDGVNDVLALREADCSIAMAEGDSATRQIANLVLLDSDFTSLPDVLFEGRRVVNNLTKVASIFFIKTIYSFLLALICIVTNLAFPFIPIQITLIDLAIEGYPSFFLSFEGDKTKVHKGFLKTVLTNALPNALLVILNIVVVYLYSQSANLSAIETTTVMYYLLVGVSLLAVIRACMPFNPLRIFLAVTTTVGVYVAAFLFQSLLHIDTLTSNTLPLFLIMITISAIIRIIVELVKKRKVVPQLN